MYSYDFWMIKSWFWLLICCLMYFYNESLFLIYLRYIEIMAWNDSLMENAWYRIYILYLWQWVWYNWLLVCCIYHEQSGRTIWHCIRYTEETESHIFALVPSCQRVNMDMVSDVAIKSSCTMVHATQFHSTCIYVHILCLPRFTFPYTQSSIHNPNNCANSPNGCWYLHKRHGFFDQKIS